MRSFPLMVNPAAMAAVAVPLNTKSPLMVVILVRVFALVPLKSRV